MECRPALPLRTELLNVLDQQIEMLTKKTFASFTNEEMGAFKNREQRIRELQTNWNSLPREPDNLPTREFSPPFITRSS